MNEWRIDSNTVIVHIKQSWVLLHTLFSVGYHSSSSNRNLSVD